MWSKLGSQSKSSTPVEVDFLNLCKQNVRSIVAYAKGRNLFNQIQCQDLSSKLFKTTQNIGELLLHCGASAVHFRLALENLYRYLEKAKVLVSKCGEEDWCTAAVIQIQNENAFRGILLDVGLCYNAIYEQAKSTSEDWSVLPEDLLESSVFRPAKSSDVLLDQQNLEKKLEDLANEPSSSNLFDRYLPGRSASLKQCLARYLLVKLSYTAEQSQATTLDTCSAILWAKESQPSGTWGKNSRFLGAGAGASGVCSTKWMGIPCAKKEFHPQAAEGSFLKEAGILAHLKHPCIVNFFCCGNGKEKGDRFIAMELMENSLAHLIEEQMGAYFSLPALVDIMVQIARGMCYLHEEGVAHRDLKPQNVVVNKLSFVHLVDHFLVKLVDFGMSKTKVQVCKSNTISACGVGTTIYRAPEIHPMAHPNGKGKAIWFKADVFSFAFTCSHLLSLKVPFGDSKITELYSRLMNGQRPELPEGCPFELVMLIKDCWNTNPRSRPSFVEICARLETFRHKLLRGFSTLDQGLRKEEMDFNSGFEFINATIEEKSLNQKATEDDINEEQGETYDSDGISRNDLVSVISCTCDRSLQFLPQSPYRASGRFTCNICRKYTDGEVYHCETCHFDACPDCAEIKDKVTVFFHADILHLLVQNYYDSTPDAICGFCEESLQGSEWVYRCNQCNFHVHALCTKYTRKVNHFHSHCLTLVPSVSQRSLSCRCCNGNCKGYRYICTQKRCAFELHPLCNILPKSPPCRFDNSHRLLVHIDPTAKGLQCSRCDAQGFSRLYHCKDCNMDIHLNCVNDMEEEKNDWNGAYENFMLEYGNKANHTRMDMISKLLDMLLISSSLETTSSSSSRPPPVVLEMTMTAPTVQTLTSRQTANSSNAFDDSDVNACGNGACTTVDHTRILTADRKAKTMATKEARQKVRPNLKAEQGIKLESLRKILEDLKSSKIDADVLAATHEKLKKIQDFVQEVITSKMRQVPRIGLINYCYIQPNKLLTLLPARMWGVHLTLLCEEPGHEHIVRLQRRNAISGYHIKDMVREQVEKLQPFLGSGLEVVRMALSRAPHITDLDSVNLPNLGEESWDLRAAINPEKHDIQTIYEDEDDVELQKMAEDTAAESLLSYLEDNEISIFDTFGLLRVRYTETDQGNCPQYKQGVVAWLCTEHQNRSLEAGILEPYPLRIYHNLEYDQQRQFL